MKLRFTPRAAQDLTGIADYIRLHNIAAATRVRTAILDATQILCCFPKWDVRSLLRAFANSW